MIDSYFREIESVSISYSTECEEDMRVSDFQSLRGTKQSSLYIFRTFQQQFFLISFLDTCMKKYLYSSFFKGRSQSPRIVIIYSRSEPTRSDQHSHFHRSMSKCECHLYSDKSSSHDDETPDIFDIEKSSIRQYFLPRDSCDIKHTRIRSRRDDDISGSILYSSYIDRICTHKSCRSLDDRKMGIFFFEIFFFFLLSKLISDMTSTRK